eukprot:scaffold5896_cov116-Isochrysis_galbana.AAC.5
MARNGSSSDDIPKKVSGCSTLLTRWMTATYSVSDKRPTSAAGIGPVSRLKCERPLVRSGSTHVWDVEAGYMAQGAAAKMPGAVARAGNRNTPHRPPHCLLQFVARR